MILAYFENQDEKKPMNSANKFDSRYLQSSLSNKFGHGFDYSESTFDGEGVLINWWTEKDKKEFDKRTAQLIAQYNGFKLYQDLNVNSPFTLGENVAERKRRACD